MADHSNIQTDLDIVEVTELPVSGNVDADNLYFRTGDRLYFRPVRPKGQGGNGAQATFDYPAGNNAARGLRITFARSIAAGEQSNGIVVEAREGSSTSASLESDSTIKKLTIFYEDGDDMSDVKTAVDAISGVSSAYYNGGATTDDPSDTVGESSGGTTDYNMLPLPVVNNYVYEREALGILAGRTRPLIATTSTLPTASVAVNTTLDYTWDLEGDATDLGIFDSSSTEEYLVFGSVAPTGWIGLMVEAVITSGNNAGIHGHVFIPWGGNSVHNAGNTSGLGASLLVTNRSTSTDNRLQVRTGHHNDGQWRLYLAGENEDIHANTIVKVYAVTL